MHEFPAGTLEGASPYGTDTRHDCEDNVNCKRQVLSQFHVLNIFGSGPASYQPAQRRVADYRCPYPRIQDSGFNSTSRLILPIWCFFQVLCTQNTRLVYAFPGSKDQPMESEATSAIGCDESTLGSLTFFKLFHLFRKLTYFRYGGVGCDLNQAMTYGSGITTNLQGSENIRCERACGPAWIYKCTQPVRNLLLYQI
ncbi:hypothetical protein NEOLEDRAFT_607572 [Neolentinus lepideus HHB14362 ss-1]|uniref:Uncharacterized protein n=1 Tax=Neolentinus lepideus HHB14362 ss-1 TaxID=1314782 RepID=A0A165VDQ1_9AGAM|nr:hypothetical protein NEOLEDRAFT_607572 [Neolentinus lepideus HHB14362 ss-1]